MESEGDEIFDMLFKRCSVSLLVVFYYFRKVRASCFGFVMYLYTEGDEY